MANAKAKPAAKKPAAKKPATKKPATKKPAAGQPEQPVVDGGAEAAAWAAARGLSTAGKTRWNVRIALDVKDEPASDVYSGDTASRFMLAIFQNEWGFTFVHKGKTSHIRRVTEDFINGSDDWKLLKEMPPLDQLGAFVRGLEAKHKIALKRPHANISTNLKGGKDVVRTWLATL